MTPGTDFRALIAENTMIGCVNPAYYRLWQQVRVSHNLKQETISNRSPESNERNQRNDAELLATGDTLDIQDQSGKRLEIPLSERKALILAMSFHEKGRAALKRKRYDFALVRNCMSKLT